MNFIVYKAFDFFKFYEKNQVQDNFNTYYYINFKDEI